MAICRSPMPKTPQAICPCYPESRHSPQLQRGREDGGGVWPLKPAGLPGLPAKVRGGGETVLPPPERPAAWAATEAAAARTAATTTVTADGARRSQVSLRKNPGRGSRRVWVLGQRRSQGHTDGENNPTLQTSQNTPRCIDKEGHSSSSRPPLDFGEEGEEEKGEDETQGLRFVRGKKLLSDLSTWGIGGPCNYFIQVFNEAQLISAIRYCLAHSIQFLVIGKGSNCLFDDHGFSGCIILNRIEFLERIGPGAYRVGSGYPFNRLGIQCSSEGFTGLEFAGGIPGSVGGAVFMNAGADGQDTADTIDSVSIITMDGRRRVVSRSDLTFGYRMSSFQDMEDLAAITAVTIRLTPSASALEQQRASLLRRKKSQPLGDRSAGSVFRNPPLSSAAELIEKARLKGYRVGGAKVSEVHANFFINCDGSTSKDMLQLIGFVKEEVLRRFRIELKEEIRYVPYQ